MAQDQRFDVFISYNSRDKDLVISLAKVLKGRNIRVWIDVWEAVPGRMWQEAIEEIVQSTNSAAVCLGAGGIGPWERPEMRICLGEFVRRGMPVIPLLLPGCKKEPKLPLFLTELTWVDLRRGMDDEGLDRLEWGIRGTKPPSRTRK